MRAKQRFGGRGGRTKEYQGNDIVCFNVTALQHVLDIVVKQLRSHTFQKAGIQILQTNLLSAKLSVIELNVLLMPQ